MDKTNHVTRLTPATCEEVQSRILEAYQEIAEDGLVIECTGWRDMEPGLS